jgi:hypothetical protein
MGQNPPREAEYASILSWARLADVKGTMNWQLTPLGGGHGTGSLSEAEYTSILSWARLADVKGTMTGS